MVLPLPSSDTAMFSLFKLERAILAISCLSNLIFTYPFTTSTSLTNASSLIIGASSSAMSCGALCMVLASLKQGRAKSPIFGSFGFSNIDSTSIPVLVNSALPSSFSYITNPQTLNLNKTTSFSCMT